MKRVCGRAAILLVMLGCRPPQPPSAESILAAALPALLEGPPASACGVTPVPARPSRVLLVTAKQCLSCRSMGLVMRRLAAAGGGRLSVVVPTRDAESVCAFAREERVEIPILALPDGAFPAGELSERFLYGEINDRGAITRARLAADAQELFRSSIGDAARPAAGASPH